MADVHSLQSTFTKYTLCIIGIYAPNLVHKVYDLYLAYG